jgi:hypothetical protein
LSLKLSITKIGGIIMLKFFAKILASKIGQILIDIALSGVGKILQDLLDTTRNAMAKAEDIGNYIKANFETIPKEEIIANISVVYGYDITEEQYVYFSSSLKGLGKFSIAFDIIKKISKEKGKDYEEYIINFAIEMIFIKYFKG